MDALKFFGTLLEDGLGPGVEVQSQLSEKTFDQLPAVVYTFIGSGQSLNGPGLWPGSLIINVLGATLTEATTIAKQVYDLVWSWDQPGDGVVTGQGAVETVEDESLFSLSPKSIVIGKTASQYDGSFGVSIRTFTP